MIDPNPGGGGNGGGIGTLIDAELVLVSLNPGGKTLGGRGAGGGIPTGNTKLSVLGGGGTEGGLA